MAENWEPKRTKETIGPQTADVVDGFVETGKNLINDLKDGKFEPFKVLMQSLGDIIEGVTGGKEIPGEFTQAVATYGVAQCVTVIITDLEEGVRFYFPNPEPGLEEWVVKVLTILKGLADLFVAVAVKKAA